ncbi:MAG: CPBP family glutamic-type intramembrane protease [bacterium]|nr:CPBP family glutamic-type intramembrane protease [bacterium]
MWDWTNDKEIYHKFCGLSLSERTILFIWATLPLVKLSLTGEPSRAFVNLAAFLSVFGLTYDSLYAVSCLFSAYILVANWDLLVTIFRVPKCDLAFFKSWAGISFYTTLLILGLISAYLFWKKPEILSAMRGLSNHAQVPDWIFSALMEEITDRFVIYYSMVLIFGRSGGFLFSMLVFALLHNYNYAYMLNMMLAGSLHIMLLLWSGSLSLPLLVHILSNSALFFWFKFTA